MPGHPSTRDRSETDEQIMQATYRALCEHGYAGLTMQAIASEYGKTAAAIHYHYETKEELLAAFLEYLLDRFVDRIHEVDTVDPEERLELLLDRFLSEESSDQNFLTAMIELRAQAPYNDAVQAQFQHNDEYVRYMLRTVIRDGIDQGVFSEVDAEHVAQSCMTIVDGARARYVTLNETNALEEARRTIDEYLDAILK